jgi:ribosome maturation protein Sdo1
MVKVEFTGSVEEVKKEIREFIEANCSEVINSTEKAISRALEKATSNVEEKKEVAKKVEEAPAQKLPIVPAKKEEAPVAVATPLPTKTAEYTADDLQRIAAAWVAKDIENNRKAMKDLLAKFGVKAITVLPQESYGAFVQELKNLGVDI